MTIARVNLFASELASRMPSSLIPALWEERKICALPLATELHIDVSLDEDFERWKKSVLPPMVDSLAVEVVKRRVRRFLCPSPPAGKIVATDICLIDKVIVRRVVGVISPWPLAIECFYVLFETH